MKVIAVKPGHVTAVSAGSFGFVFYLVDGHGIRHRIEDETPRSANAAKQAMREKVARERKRHGLEDAVIRGEDIARYKQEAKDGLAE